MGKIKKNRQGVMNVAQKVIIINDGGKMLTIRRSQTDSVRPFYWDLPGGELNLGESAQEGIIREIKEETGLEVCDLFVIDVISRFNNKDEFWVTICYKAKTNSNNVVLSYEHDEFKWVDVDSFFELKASPRNKEFVEIFKDSFSQK